MSEQALMVVIALLVLACLLGFFLGVWIVG